MNKFRLGKLSGYSHVAENYFDILEKLKVNELSITTDHAHLAGEFEWSHRDPFDRLLAAQATTDNLILLTNDPAFQELDWVTTLW
ncbi:MAG: type II toxin-antitoxin system VapC family toxin [Defluviitaleaceae bacterium]|nr:type II toxin-antitoxin system VapC family toxin [Defluviitaleaceae bacterium]